MDEVRQSQGQEEKEGARMGGCGLARPRFELDTSGNS